jgi:hypothetical protein
MIDRHVADDRLIDICVTRAPAPAEQAHLAACAQCETRRSEIVGILAELDTAATDEASAAFPEARLERQHARILHRVEHDGRPGQLVAFPASHHSRSRLLLPPRPRIRWAAAAAAAAFVAGVLTGQVTHNFTTTNRAMPSHIVANETGQPTLMVVPTTFSEEEFLDQIEVAAARNGPAALRPLDAMTPRAWDVR